MQHDSLVKLFNNIPDAVLHFDHDLHIVFANPAAKQLLNQLGLQALWNLPHKVESQLMHVWLGNLKRVLDTQQELTFEFDTTISQIEWYFEAYFSPDIVNDNHSIGINCIVRDITSRKQLELHRLHLAIQKNQLELATTLSQHIAHDLRTPLSSILTNLYLLRKSNVDKQQRYIDRIEVQTHRVSKMLDSILLMNRLDSAKLIQKNSENLSLFLVNITDRFHNVVQEKNQQLICLIEPDLMAEIDPRYLQVAIENILHNAVQYTGIAGVITLRAFHNESGVVIEIEDNGIGIQEEYISHIFDRFYRVNSARTLNSMTASNGLGLSISKAVIEQHGGSISVVSEGNQGCCFTINILTRPDMSSIKIERIPEKMLSGWDILIIDDDVDSLELARYVLDYHGANVYTALNGIEGINVAVSIQPRFIICDLSMPEMDGWDFLKELGSQSRELNIPVIALTAYDKRKNRERAIDAGFHSYLTKPLTAQVFMDQLLKLLLDIPQLTNYLNK